MAEPTHGPSYAQLQDKLADAALEMSRLRARIAALEAGIREAFALRTLDEWHEGIGDVLWWRFPVEEPPYVGGPLDYDWPGYHTHWTPIEPIARAIAAVKAARGE